MNQESHPLFTDGTPFHTHFVMYKYFISMLMLFLCIGIHAQKKTAFNGILKDFSGNPIKSAHVYVKSPRDYALTNKQGEFGLTDVGATDTLHIEVKKHLYLLPVDGKRSIIIRLGDEQHIESTEDQGLFDQGFSFIPRRERTNPGNFISGEELRRSGYHDVLSALQGRVPGLDITGSSRPGEEKDINMRGTRTIKGDTTPLFYINSVRVPSFEGISLNDIDYVEVMKEASAYGSEGGNGAIIVHTYIGK